MKRRRWVIVIFIGLLTAGCSLTLPSSEPRTVPSSPVSASAVAPSLGSSALPTFRSPESPAPSPQPSVVLAGGYPHPDATIPPGAPPIVPGLRIEAIAAAVGAEGLACVSEAGTYQEGSGGYTLGCEGRDMVGHAKFDLSVTYWMLGGISEIYLAVYADGGVLSPTAPINTFSAISALTSGELAKTWVVEHLDDQACSPGCIRSFGSVEFELQLGVNGARALHVWATRAE